MEIRYSHTYTYFVFTCDLQPLKFNKVNDGCSLHFNFANCSEPFIADNPLVVHQLHFAFQNKSSQSLLPAYPMQQQCTQQKWHVDFVGMQITCLVTCAAVYQDILSIWTKLNCVVIMSEGQFMKDNNKRLFNSRWIAYKTEVKTITSGFALARAHQLASEKT